jgi:DNA-binding NtrC family response regulator
MAPGNPSEVLEKARISHRIGAMLYDGMKQSSPDITCFLSSGYSIEGQAREIMERGCSGFIQKPFSLEEFSRKIKEILSRG